MVAERRMRVANAYLRGEPQMAIARREGVARTTIATDLQVVRAEWLESSVMDFGARKAQELAKIDHIEEVAWQAWQRSLDAAEVLHAETTKGRASRKGEPLPDLSKTAKTVRPQAGDPRFLERIAWCIERRCKLLGLDAPLKHDLAGVVATIDWDKLCSPPREVDVIEERIRRESLPAPPEDGRQG